MKIQTLINKLKQFQPNAEIYISGDPEGNDIRTLDEVAPSSETPLAKIIIWPTDTIIDISEPCSCIKPHIAEIEKNKKKYCKICFNQIQDETTP